MIKHFTFAERNARGLDYNLVCGFIGYLEPAGGFQRSICRLQFGRSGIELHRRTKLFIPHCSCAKSECNYRRRKDPDQTAMKIHRHADPTPQSERHIIARHENFFESVTDLEFS